MSYSNFKKALEEAKNLNEYEHGKGVSKEIIEQAEQALGIKFSRQLYEYLNIYGYIGFFGFDLDGIHDENFTDHGLVGETLDDRKNMNLPPKWVQIHNTCVDGECVYLDFEHLNSDGEPRAILGGYEGSDEYYVIEEEGEDFGDFLLKEVKLGHVRDINRLLSEEMVQSYLDRAKYWLERHRPFNPFVMWVLKDGTNIVVECSNKKTEEIYETLIEVTKNEVDKLKCFAICKEDEQDGRKIMKIHAEHEEGLSIETNASYIIKYGLFKNSIEIDIAKTIAKEAEYLVWKKSDIATLYFG